MKKIVLLLLLLLLSASVISAQDAPLFTATTDASARDNARPSLVGAERERYVTLDSALLANATQRNATLTLNLFEDVTFTAVADRVEPRMNADIGAKSGVQWFGHIEGIANSNAIFVISTDGATPMLTGRVMTPTESYYIAPAGNGVHRITEIDLVEAHEALEVNGGEVPPDSNAGAPFPLPATRADSGDFIDLLVVYTPAAQAIFGGEAQTILAIEEMVAMTNQSYENSLINQRINLVHIAPVNYVEDPSPYTSDLNAVTSTSDGKMDEVHLLRNSYYADLVMLITGTPDDQRNYCGVAWLLTGNANYGFGVSEAVCAGTVVMPHELGHNMGATHDVANGSSGYYSYSFGYQDVKEGANDWGDFVTVMAYGRNGQCPPDNPLDDVGEAPICPHILQWSDPAQTYNGKPLGNANTNNVLTLNNTASIVANFRISSDVPMSPTGLNGNLNAETSTINLSWNNPSLYDTIRVERSNDNGLTYDPLATINGGVKVYSDSALACDTTYKYRVIGILDSVESNPSNVATIYSGLCINTADLVVNGGFETFDTPQSPSNWILKGDSNKDKVKCDKPEKDKYFAFSGNCAFQFKGEGQESTRLQQLPDTSTINTGDTLGFSAYVSTKNAVSGGKLRLIIKYTDDTKTKGVVDIVDTIGATSDYVKVSVPNESVLNDIAKLKVQIRYKGLVTTGKIYVDDVSLIHAFPSLD